MGFPHIETRVIGFKVREAMDKQFGLVVDVIQAAPKPE
jgi:hypothetical protein